MYSMQLKFSGKQQGPVTGKDCSSGICSYFIQERKDEVVGARKPQCVNFYLKQENRVNFTDALFPYNTSTLLSASAHLFPFSCSLSAANGSITSHTLYRNPPPLLASFGGLFWTCYFSYLSLKQPLFPFLLHDPLFLSLALSSWHRSCDTCEKLLQGPCFRQDTDILRVLDDRAIFGACKYENFLS